MMKSRLALLFINAAVLATVSGCSYVQSLFPDKEKDYQYTTEIPPLNIPANIGRASAINAPGLTIPNAAATPDASPDVAPVEATMAEQPVATAVAEAEAAPVNADKAAAAPITPESADVPPANAPTTKQPVIQVELVKSAEGTTQLHLAAPFDKAWRIVDKALSRKSIEVTQRNKEEGVFHVQYDPDEQALEDDSFLDEITFVFSGFQGDEKAYVLKLVEKNQQTEVSVLDEDYKPSSDTASSNLLTLLQKTIETNFADK